MTKRAVTRPHRGAVATGAAATGAASLGAASLGALAMGAVAIGAIAVGALAIGRLRVGRARLRRVEIGELTVGRLDIAAIGLPGASTAVVRVRAAQGRGDAFESFLSEGIKAAEAWALLCQARRSPDDSDLFLLSEISLDDTTPAPALSALLRLAAERGLLASPGPAEVERFRAI